MDSKLKRTYAAHRKALREELPDGLILVAGGNPLTRNDDVDHVFRQRSDFLYLTGIEHPGYALLMNGKTGDETLLVPRIDQHHRVWLGHVPSPAETRKLYGVQDVAYLDELPKLVKKSKGRLGSLYTDREGGALLRGVKHGLRKEMRRYRDALDYRRAMKSPGEIELMQAANTASAAGHVAAMRAARPGMYEYQVQAVLEHEFHSRGMKHCAYPSIVATGVNGAVLHYHHNDQKIRKGDLLLIDAGAECRGYAADITRTFPVSGKFTRRQKDVYQVVLEAQLRCIDAVRPGNTSRDVHALSMRVLTEGMKDLGFLKGDVDGLVESEAIRIFYPHGLGHSLGLDVHDVDGGKRLRVKGKRPKNLRTSIRLEPGFVMTVEPGIYFIEALIQDREVRKKHRGQVDFAKAEAYLDFGGVRIEDDVIVQKKGPPRNLTRVPSSVEDVEAACRGEA